MAIASELELYKSATCPPASAMASATAQPIPADAPVMAVTLLLMENCWRTLSGMLGKGLGRRGVELVSSRVMDMFGGLGGGLGWVGVEMGVMLEVLRDFVWRVGR